MDATGAGMARATGIARRTSGSVLAGVVSLRVRLVPPKASVASGALVAGVTGAAARTRVARGIGGASGAEGGIATATATGTGWLP